MLHLDGHRLFPTIYSLKLGRARDASIEKYSMLYTELNRTRHLTSLQHSITQSQPRSLQLVFDILIRKNLHLASRRYGDIFPSPCDP
jgi:hypothetical protein